jgi:hypothetical protein
MADLRRDACHGQWLRVTGAKEGAAARLPVLGRGATFEPGPLAIGLSSGLVVGGRSGVRLAPSPRRSIVSATSGVSRPGRCASLDTSAAARGMAASEGTGKKQGRTLIGAQIQVGPVCHEASRSVRVRHKARIHWPCGAQGQNLAGPGAPTDGTPCIKGRPGTESRVVHHVERVGNQWPKAASHANRGRSYGTTRWGRRAR